MFGGFVSRRIGLPNWSALDALMRLQLYGITESQILNLCRAIGANDHVLNRWLIQSQNRMRVVALDSKTNIVLSVPGWLSQSIPTPCLYCYIHNSTVIYDNNTWMKNRRRTLRKKQTSFHQQLIMGQCKITFPHKSNPGETQKCSVIMPWTLSFRFNGRIFSFLESSESYFLRSHQG